MEGDIQSLAAMFDSWYWLMDALEEQHLVLGSGSRSILTTHQVRWVN